MRALDLVVVVLYFAGVLGAGALLGGRQRDAADYFLGRRGLPWWAIMLSIVATETSALTIISVPGIAATGNLTFLQLSFGYLVGRLGVAAYLLPGYFNGTQDTAYQRLERRFGPLARRFASGMFLVTRALGDSVRVFATAIPIALILWPGADPTYRHLAWGVLGVGVITVIYTWAGGLRAVVWVDVVQLVVYLLGGIVTLWIALDLAGGAGRLADAWNAGKLRVFDFHVSLTTTYTFWGGLIGGGMLTAASHGTDHLIVQRLLAARDLRDARRALIGSGVMVIVQFALFLLVGTSLWLAGAARAGLRGDAIYPGFIVEHLYPGLAGLVVASILAAAMSTVASSLNSLSSASTNDFYAPLTGRRDPQHLLRIGRWLTLAWAVVLVGGALLFRSRDTPVVVVALSIASLTYGALLGTYILGGIATRVRQIDAIIAITACMIVMIPVVFAGSLATALGQPRALVLLSKLAWPWYVPLGTAVTVAVGLVASQFGRIGATSAG
jgi:SSS family transporter